MRREEPEAVYGGGAASTSIAAVNLWDRMSDDNARCCSAPQHGVGCCRQLSGGYGGTIMSRISVRDFDLSKCKELFIEQRDAVICVNRTKIFIRDLRGILVPGTMDPFRYNRVQLLSERTGP